MKQILAAMILLSTWSIADIARPAHKTYYISGIAFDTKTYCADFDAVIDAQAKKIKALEAEVAQLHQQLQKQLSTKLKNEHEAALKKTNTPAPKSKSKIIISDKPI